MQKFTVEEKKKFVVSYLKGTSAKSICSENEIAKSTFYDWVNRYSNQSKQSNEFKFYTENKKTQSAIKKKENMLKILQSVNCKVNDPLQVKLKELVKLHGEFSVHELCEALNVSRGTFYNHIKRNKKDKKDVVLRREQLKPIIKDIFDEYGQIFGTRRMKIALDDLGYKVSRKLISELMREINLVPTTINSKKLYYKNIERERTENLLNNNFKVNKPNSVWVCDFTSAKINKSIFYICAIIDLYARKIIAHSITYSQTAYVLNKTFKDAIKTRNPKGNELIFHSDRGCQFTSNSFKKLLMSHKVKQSFSEKGNPYNNSVAESFFAHLKTEEIYRRIYKSDKEFIKCVNLYIENFNNTRPHSTNQNLSPCKKEENYYNSKKNKAC